jgi:hypothetical protein
VSTECSESSLVSGVPPHQGVLGAVVTCATALSLAPLTAASNATAPVINPFNNDTSFLAGRAS